VTQTVRKYTITAESLNLQPGEIGVEYKTSDHSICAKVHSVKQAESIRSATLRRPMEGYDKNCLFVYGVYGKDTKLAYTQWTTKTLGYDASDWRRRTHWFESDLIRRPVEGDAAFEAFLKACPMLDKKGKPVRTVAGPGLHTLQALRLAQPSSPAEVHGQEPVTPGVASSPAEAHGQEPVSEAGSTPTLRETPSPPMFDDPEIEAFIHGPL
jgi:hypothetical protein